MKKLYLRKKESVAWVLTAAMLLQACMPMQISVFGASKTDKETVEEDIEGDYHEMPEKVEDGKTDKFESAKETAEGAGAQETGEEEIDRGGAEEIWEEGIDRGGAREEDIDFGFDEESLDGVVEMKLSEYNAKMNAFISDDRWKDWAVYYNADTLGDPFPYISSHKCTGCFAYGCDFTKYMYGVDKYHSGEVFYDPAEIRTGDVISITNHTFVVLRRDGNTLYTAEGAVKHDGKSGQQSNSVRISDSVYSISDGELVMSQLIVKGRSFLSGYHHVNLIDDSDLNGPEITNIKVTGVNSSSFRVYYEAEDDNVLKNTRIAVWTQKGGQDDHQLYVPDTSGDHHFSKKINTEDHNSESGIYSVEIYAYDVAGNQSVYAFTVDVPQRGTPMEDSQAAGRTIEDGEYLVESMLDEDFAQSIVEKDAEITVAGFGFTIKSKLVEMTHDLEGTAARLQLRYHNDGYYMIEDKATGLVLTAASIDNGAYVYFSELNTDNANLQLWSIEKNIDGSYSIRSKYNGYYLDVWGMSTDDGTEVRLHYNNGDINQKWKFKTIRIPATSVKPETDSVSVNVGERASIRYEILPESTTEKSVSINSSDKSVAEVIFENGQYYVSGKKPGTAEITIRVSGTEVSGSFAVAVSEKKDPSSGSGGNGTSGSTSNNGASGSTSNNGASGSTSNNGASGSTSNNGASGSTGNNGTPGGGNLSGNPGGDGTAGDTSGNGIPVKPGENGSVSGNDQWMRFTGDEGNVVIAGGKTSVLALLQTASSNFADADRIKFVPENKKTAKVNKQGLVTGKNPGKTKIFMMGKFGKEWRKLSEIEVVVKKPVMKKQLLLSKENKVEAKKLISDCNCLPTEWVSSNPAVAKVDKEGMIIPLAPGKTKLIAVYGTGKNSTKKKYKTTLVVQ